MKNFKYLFAIFSIFLFNSCIIRTIYPLFDDNEIIFNSKIIGKWMNHDSTEIWEFSKYRLDDSTRNQNKYRLLIIDIHKDETNDSSIFEAMTANIGKHLFLDIIIDNHDLVFSCGLNIRKSAYIINTHTFYKLVLTGDSLTLAEMDNEWFNKNQNKFRIKFIPEDVVGNDNITITSRTKELQKFINKYANDKKAFPETGYLHRID